MGDTLRLPAADGTAELSIVGLLADPAGTSGDEVYVSLPVAQDLLELPGRINTIEILFTAEADPQATTLAVLDQLGPGFKAGPLDSGTQFIASLEIAGAVFTFFGVLVLAMAGFIIFNTFRTVVAERRRDIGLLRAVGASQRDVVGLMMIESLLQGLAGTLLGLVAGYLFVQGLLAAMGQVWMQRVNFPLGEARFSWQNLLVAVLLGVGVTLIGGLLPAISASRISPIEALRPSMARFDNGAGSWAGNGQRSRIAWSFGLAALALLALVTGNLALASLGLLLFLAALVVVSPILITPITNFFGRQLTLLYVREGYLAQANLNRQPGRAAVTVTAMMIGLAILLALTGMVTSVTTGVVGNIDRSLGGDFLLMPQSQVLSGGNVGAGPELAESLRGTPGIVAVTTLRATNAQANDVDVQVIGLDPDTYPVVAEMDITAGDPERVFWDLDTSRTLIVNTIYASRNGTELGDVLTLNTPEGPFAYEVVGVGSDYLNAQASAVFMSQANLEADFGETADLLLMADREGGTDPDQLKSRIEALAGEYPALTLFGPGEYRDQILRQGYGRLAIFYLMLAFVAVPSLIALANTLGISVIERTREIGVLRAVGASRKQVRRLITAESLLMAAMGIAFGIVAGVWLGFLLVQGLNVFGYPANYSFPWSGVLLSAIVGLIMALLAALLPARQAARMNIVKALQYE
ncbi:MAG TPA: FtsX-like permease family protein, partial [Anaerolineae bacterium]|nr:FtsX-like permease family protein [Anaerolineae bacterium]